MSSTGQATSTSSHSNIQLIVDALADYAKVTGIDLSKNPFATNLEQSSSPEAVLQLLQGREKAFKEYRDGDWRLIRCLTPAVNVLQAFSGVLGEAVNLIPFPPASAMFAGIDALLDAASGVSSSYDALLDLFDCLGNFLKRLEIYTTIPPTPIMTDIIVKIMVELLSVLALATKQIKQGRFKKFAKKLLGDCEIESILRRLDRLTEDEARTTIAQTMGVVYGLVGNMKIVMEDGKASTDSIRQDLVSLHHVLNEINKMKRDQLRWEVQQWLSPPDPSTNHNFVRKSRHSGTAAWFFESSVLIEWKERGSLLWIHGKPGAGKSTLLSAIVQDVQGMHAAGLATMAYYYFDFRDVKKQDCYGLLSSLISQLSSESDSCFNILSQLYSDNARGVQKPDLDALKDCLTDMLSLPGQGSIYIIIDAVDECPNSSGTPSAREEVLELIEELVGLELPNLHLCVASRPEIDIRQVLEPLTPLQISLHDESGQKEDIIAYIKFVVRSDRRMRKWREEDQNLVIDTLCQNADGMFRWVVCQVDELRRCFPASIRSALADLPESLDKTYERTLLGIDKQKRKYAQRLFQCLSVSIRPLRIDELAEILAIEFDATAPPSFKEVLRPLDAEEAVFSACSSLIAVVNREGGQVVQFSHFTVKEFLTSDRLAAIADERLSCYHILPERAHTLLAHAGISVLLRLDDNIDRSAIDHFPLAPYAARYWVDHAQFGNVASHIEEVMGCLFDPAIPHFAAWVWLYDIDHHWAEPMSSIHPTQPEAVPLYYAALCGFGGFVERLLVSHSPDINSRGGFHTTPLHAAAAKGHVEVTSVLLKGGADPNSRDHLGRVPLHRVSQGGHFVTEQSSFEIAQLLINSGANVNIFDDDGRTPLHAAAVSGYREITHQLLVSGASLDAQDKWQNTPLHLSCETGKLDVSRLFIDCGSDLNSRDEDGGTPLHAASSTGHFSIAKLLIDRGANVDSRSDKDETPLDSAAAYGHLDVVRFLIESGAAVSVQDNNGWTPFHSASNFGRLHIVKFLLECGIDVDIRNNSEETPLDLASGSGQLDVARFLIEHGADIHTKDNKGWNPVHIASRNGNLDIVRILVDAGVAVDIWNGTQMTPLALVLASGNGDVDVGRFLIERGADVNLRDKEGSAPLHLASRYGHLDMTRLLLDNGVDPNIQNDNLGTPLYLASANGHFKVAEVLVQRGASVDMSNDMQETPLDQAAGNGNFAIAHLLIDNGANLHSADSSGWTPLHTASYCGHLGVVKLLLGRGADVGVLNKGNETAADLASENGKAEVARLIAEYKADPDIQHNIRSTTQGMAEYGVDEDGRMASLHDAAEQGNINVVKSLLELGVDIDGRNAYTETPLHNAVAKGKVDIARLLIDRGAKVNSRDKWGQTPLYLASRYGHLKVVKLLLERDADVDALDSSGNTPLQVSVQRGYREIADLFREHASRENKG